MSHVIRLTDPAVHRALKVRAAEQHVSLSILATDLLRVAVGMREGTRGRPTRARRSAVRPIPKAWSAR